MDIMSDSSENHSRFRTFNVIDDFYQNDYIERFNQTYRTEVLDLYVIKKLEQARKNDNRIVRDV